MDITGSDNVLVSRNGPDVYFDYKTPTTIDTNAVAINNAIRNILLTRIGSVPGKPEFGSNIMDLVFELMDGRFTKDLLMSSIIAAIIKWEPRITILDIVIKEIPEYNRVIADITYIYTRMSQNVSTKVTIPLKD